MAILREASDVNEARRYLDAVSITLPELAQVDVTPVELETFRGSWFTGKTLDPTVTLLYLHGGGYSFYPTAYANFVASVALATNCKTFALDYRLAPEHRFPAQLEDALNAYRWLLQNGTNPNSLVIGGDSAGAHLALSAVLALRDLKLPLPALAVSLSPPTDFDPERVHLVDDQHGDWIEKQMLLRWADWFCDPDQRRNPLVSPLDADLHGLPPIYIQAGQAEILYDSIQAFANHARSQGADVVLESWEDMNHVFQIFGRCAPQSLEALQRLGELITAKVRVRERTKVGSD
jgi:acetyl esterase/lipase